MLKILILLFLYEVIFSQTAHAYLDLGTGSYMFQILIAFVLALIFYAKSILRRIKSFIDKLRGKNKS
jgi:hypothetical protein